MAVVPTPPHDFRGALVFLFRRRPSNFCRILVPLVGSAVVRVFRGRTWKTPTLYRVCVFRLRQSWPLFLCSLSRESRAPESHSPSPGFGASGCVSLTIVPPNNCPMLRQIGWASRSFRGVSAIDLHHVPGGAGGCVRSYGRVSLAHRGPSPGDNPPGDHFIFSVLSGPSACPRCRTHDVEHGYRMQPLLALRATCNQQNKEATRPFCLECHTVPSLARPRRAWSVSSLMGISCLHAKSPLLQTRHASPWLTQTTQIVFVDACRPLRCPSTGSAVCSGARRGLRMRH